MQLRSELEAFVRDRGLEDAERELKNAGKVLRRLSEDPYATKLHNMKEHVLERMIGDDLSFAFLEAGFEYKLDPVTAEETFQFRADAEAFAQLEVALFEVQRAADFAIDWENATVKQIGDLVQVYGDKLPAVTDVNDSVLTPIVPKASAMSRPRKPWEKLQEACVRVPPRTRPQPPHLPPPPPPQRCGCIDEVRPS